MAPAYGGGWTDTRWLNAQNLLREQAMDTFSTNSLALQAQKKLLSKMTSKAVVAMLVYDTSSEVLDELYRATKEFTRRCKEAQEPGEGGPEAGAAAAWGPAGQGGAGTAVSLLPPGTLPGHDGHQLPAVLAVRLLESRDLLHQAVGPQLTAKSHSRVNHVFGHLADCDFLAMFYGPAEPYRSHLCRICEDLGRMLDEGSL
ncbi:hypothetical protein H8959_006855 [Pygathrix nigripes]